MAIRQPQTFGHDTTNTHFLSILVHVLLTFPHGQGSPFSSSHSLPETFLANIRDSQLTQPYTCIKSGFSICFHQ
jgi:hypothetical protein